MKTRQIKPAPRHDMPVLGPPLDVCFANFIEIGRAGLRDAEMRYLQHAIAKLPSPDIS